MTTPTKVSIGDIVPRLRSFSGASLKIEKDDVCGVGKLFHLGSPKTISIVLAIHNDNREMSRLYLLTDLFATWYGPYGPVQAHPQR